MHELSPENRLILNCATTVMDDESYSSSLEIIKKDINWNQVFETAKAHSVAPLMYPNLEKLNKDHSLPKNIIFQFRKSYHSTGIRNTKLYDELAVLLKDFKENNIEVMLLKGAALAIFVYKNIALRPMGDVDILIKKEDAGKGEEILIRNGYEEKPFQRKYFSELFCSLPAYKKGKLNLIEIKWGLFGYFENGYRPTFNDFVKNSKSITINNYTILVPSPQYLAEIVYCHIEKHKITGEKQLLWYCDLVELEKNYRKEIKQEFKDNLNPEEILNVKKNNHRDIYFVSAIFMNIGAIYGIYKKFLYCLGCILPGREYLLHSYNIKNQKLIYLYYIMRPFILLSKTLKSFIFTIKNLFLSFYKG